MLTAKKAQLRAQDVPELIDLLAWCSTMRDLREDLQAGIINIPAEVLEAGRVEGLSSLDYAAVVASKAVQVWLSDECRHANELLLATERRLSAIGDQPGVSSLCIFARSIRSFLFRRFPKLYPSLAKAS